MFERFTDRARRIVVFAQEEARRLNQQYIGSDHFVLAMVREGEGVAGQVLGDFNIDLDDLRARVRAQYESSEESPSHIPFTPDAKKTIEESLKEAMRLGHRYIGTEHLLLAVTSLPEGEGASLLVESGVDLSSCRRLIIETLSGYLREEKRGRPIQRDRDALGEAIHQLKESGVLDVQGFRFDPAAVKRLLDEAPRENDLPYLGRARFDNCTFDGRSSFGDVILGDGTSFSGALFEDFASFRGARFGNFVKFTGAIFRHGANFASATFSEDARFNRSAFGSPPLSDEVLEVNPYGGSSFVNARFGANASFDSASFDDWTSFSAVQFGDQATFIGTTFGQGTTFNGTRIGDGANFQGATIGAASGFFKCELGNGVEFTPVSLGADCTFVSSHFGRSSLFRAEAKGSVDLGHAIFDDGCRIELQCPSGLLSFANSEFMGAVDLEISAEWTDFRGVRFLGGAAIRAEGVLDLERAQFIGSSTISGKNDLSDGVTSDGPSIASLEGSDVNQLVLSGVNLSHCRFAGAHHLDRLRLDGPIELLRTPKGWHTGKAIPPIWRWTRRQTLIEEHAFRQGTPKAKFWSTHIVHRPNIGRPAQPQLDRVEQILAWRRDEVQTRHRVVITNDAVLVATKSAFQLTSWERVPRVALQLLDDACIDLRPASTGESSSHVTLLEDRISEARKEKDAAIEALDFEAAARFRETEKELLAERGRLTRAQESGEGDRLTEITGAQITSVTRTWLAYAADLEPQAADEYSDTPDPGRVRPADVASLYRALRKGREDAKDEPGAADFYYGEMEMRRKDGSLPWGERIVLFLFWLFSGYALRISRPLVLLALTVALAAGAMNTHGFATDRPFTRTSDSPHISGTANTNSVANEGWMDTEGWIYSLGTATAIITGPEAELTLTGLRIRVALRIIGPILIGLTLLSIRGRVKRG